MLIDSLFFGAAVGLSVLIAVPNLLIAALAPGAVGVGIAVYMHRWYERFSMAREERRKTQQVRFPEKA